MSRSEQLVDRAHIDKDENGGGRARIAGGYLPPWIAPQSLRDKPAAYGFTAGCAIFLIGLGITDLKAPVNVTVSALAIFPVLFAAWFLSLRVALGVAVLGVLLQIWLASLGSIDWLSGAADIAALSLMVAIGRFAARSWTEIANALEREGALLRERERAQERLEAVLEVAQTILAGRPVRELMQLTAERARVLAGAAIAALAVPDEAERMFTLEVVDGEAADKLRGQQVRATGASSGSVLRTDEPLVVDDLSQGFSAGIDSASELGPAMLVPLAVGPHRFGTLVLANPTGARAFESEDRTLIQLFAAQAAVALDYARAQDNVRRLAVLEDRDRISQELHDGVIQSLFAVGLELGVMAGASKGGHQQQLRDLIAEINTVIRDLRAYIHGLAPRFLNDADLKRALERLAGDFTSKLKIAARAEITDGAAVLLAPRAAEVLQFVSEALSNVARHSGSASCSVTLAVSGSDLALEIRDEGTGFDPGAAYGRGFGLSSLKVRAERLGGQLVIDSAPGAGTSVRLVIPTQQLEREARR